MIKVFFTERFLKSTSSLPKHIQEKLVVLLSLLEENPFHTKLHTKPLAGKLSGFYSFRITRDWRVIFQFIATDSLQLMDVGNRKDIYRR